MTRFDLSPLYSSTIGFDRLASLIDSIGGFEGEPAGFPPYNIEKTGDDAYRLTMAVAGFGESDLNIEVKQNSLTIAGERTSEETDRQFLHHGIAGRAFQRRFQLADYVEVKGAELKNGLLHVDLVREIPDTMKPRAINIQNKDGTQVALEDKSGDDV